MRLAACLLLLIPSALAQRVYLNLDFETSTRARAWGWATEGTDHDFVLDRSTTHSGGFSLRLAHIDGAQGNGSDMYQAVPIDLVRGKHVRFSGYVKTNNISKGGAGLGLYVIGDSGSLSADTSPLTPTGTTDWQRFTIERDISPQAIGVNVAGLKLGDGTAWFDDFSVDVDGAAIPQLPPPDTGEPSSDQLAWARRTAKPFYLSNLRSNIDDLQPFAEMAGDAHIVGLGDATYGTSEFLRMKRRMIEYLVTRKSFTIFTIEAGMLGGVSPQRLRPERQGRPAQAPPGVEYVAVGYTGGARHDRVDARVQPVGQRRRPVYRRRHFI